MLLIVGQFFYLPDPSLPGDVSYYVCIRQVYLHRLPLGFILAAHWLFASLKLKMRWHVRLAVIERKQTLKKQKRSTTLFKSVAALHVLKV